RRRPALSRRRAARRGAGSGRPNQRGAPPHRHPLPRRGEGQRLRRRGKLGECPHPARARPPARLGLRRRRVLRDVHRRPPPVRMTGRWLNCSSTPSAWLAAPPEVVYKVLSDYEHHHGNILPPAFTDYQVERGGVGAGTVVSFNLTLAGRKNPGRLQGTQPEPRRVPRRAGAPRTRPPPPLSLHPP